MIPFYRVERKKIYYMIQKTEKGKLAPINIAPCPNSANSSRTPFSHFHRR